MCKRTADALSSDAKPRVLDVLIVEDDENDRFFLKIALCRMGSGLAVQTVTNGKEAITYLRSADALPKLILLDLRMPGIDGFEFLAWRNATGFAVIPVVVLEGGGHQIDHQRAKELGALCTWVKPFEFDGYGKIVQKLTEMLPALSNPSTTTLA